MHLSANQCRHVTDASTQSPALAAHAIFLLRGRAREEKRRLSQASLPCAWAGLGGGGLVGKNTRRKHVWPLSRRRRRRRRRIAYLPFPRSRRISTSTHIRHGCMLRTHHWERSTLIAGQSPLPTNELQHIVQSVRMHLRPRPSATTTDMCTTRPSRLLSAPQKSTSTRRSPSGTQTSS